MVDSDTVYIECVSEFFDAYPREEHYDDVEACNSRLNRMLKVTKRLRDHAVETHSLSLLADARTMDAELSGLVQALTQRHAQKARASGLIAGVPGITPRPPRM